MQGSYTFASLNSRLESNKEEEEVLRCGLRVSEFGCGVSGGGCRHSQKEATSASTYRLGIQIKRHSPGVLPTVRFAPHGFRIRLNRFPAPRVSRLDRFPAPRVCPAASSSSSLLLSSLELSDT